MIIFFTPMGDFLMTRVETGLNPVSDDSFMSRVQLWAVGIAELNSPFDWIFGIGLGSYHKLFPAGYETWFNPHSLYVLTLVEHGLFGCLLLFIFILYTLIYTFRIWIKSKGQSYCPMILGFLIMLIAFWIQSVIAHAYYYNKLWYFLGFGMALINIHGKTNSGNTTHRSEIG